MTYIPPITKIHSISADAQEFFNKFGGHAWFDREEADNLDAILQGSRNMIVGEPGIGKTEMLKKMLEHLQKAESRPH
jgi:MoxR-like ATPase